MVVPKKMPVTKRADTKKPVTKTAEPKKEVPKKGVAGKPAAKPVSKTKK